MKELSYQKLLKNQATKTLYDSLSRRLHFIVIKGMEEAGLFPGVYECKMTDFNALYSKPLDFRCSNSPFFTLRRL